MTVEEGADYGAVKAAAEQVERDAKAPTKWTRGRIALLVAGAVVLVAAIAAGIAVGVTSAQRSSSGSSTPSSLGAAEPLPTAQPAAAPPAAPPAAPAAPPAPPPRPVPAPPATCQTPPGVNRLDLPNSVPPYPGYCLSWETGDEAYLARDRLQRNPGIVCGFVQSNDPQNWDQSGFDHYVDSIVNTTRPGEASSILELTLMPNYELRLLNDTTMRRWASEFARANKRGVPILLRFAHEMNGAWINYGMKPTQFIPAWRKFASIVHAATNLTAMMWAPNVGEGYPYEKSVYTPEPGTPDFLLLDSNKDGSLDPLDDPYSPYWPGSEYVDWVATSLYWTGGSWPGIVNTPPPPDHVGPTIEGNSTANINQGQAQYDFNAMFSVKYGKPMALGESGVSFYRTTAAGDVVDPGIGELAIKRAWWRQTFNHTLHTAFPRLKGIVHFDVKKDDGRGAVDYTITEGVALPEYRKEMEGVPLTWADKVLAWQCDGTVALA